MQLAKRAGFGAIVLSAVWTPPLDAPADAELDSCAAPSRQRRRRGIRPIVAVYSFSSTTPLTAEARGQFASFAASIPAPFRRCAT